MTERPTDMAYIVYTRPHNPQNLWVDQADARPGVPYTMMTVPKLVLSYLWLSWFPWPLSPPYNDGWAWSGTPKVLVHPGININAGTPLGPWLGFPDWVISAVWGSRDVTLGPPLGSQFGFSTYEVKSLGHFSQHLHLGRMNINKTWGMAELRKESGNI